MRVRRAWDRMLTLAAYVVFGVVAAALLLILAPILVRGAGAVVFRGTVEFRRLQLEEHGRGNPDAIRAEIAEASQARREVMEMFQAFRRELDAEVLTKEVREVYRAYGEELRGKNLSREDVSRLRSAAREVRADLEEAIAASDRAAALERLRKVLAAENEAPFQGTAAEGFFRIAREYRRIVETVDLSHREEYGKALDEIGEALRRLLGPLPGEARPALLMDAFGATRWDRAKVHLERILWLERWVSDGEGQTLRRARIRRETQFAGTDLAPMFPLLERNIRAMLRPRLVVYWQYFLDDSSMGHFFGGVGPEIVGTLLLTLLATLVAIVLGVIAAAYLIECAGDNPVTLVIRACINTLAGVPSIVFGLFGMAFFLLFLFPRLGLPDKSSILAGGLTLALLVLPVMIRAGEEAIRAVPHTYKEAALALGAGRFRAFVSVILPAALPGILTGVILSMSRAAGETAPIMFTAAVALGPIPQSILHPTRTLSYGSYDMAVGDRVAAMAPHNQFGMVATLVLLVLTLNLAAILIRARITKKLLGR